MTGGVNRLALMGTPSSLPKLLYTRSEDRQSEFEEFHSKMRYPPKKITGLMENDRRHEVKNKFFDQFSSIFRVLNHVYT